MLINNRHKVVFFITLVGVGCDMAFGGATTAEGFGLLMLGISAALLIGSDRALHVSSEVLGWLVATVCVLSSLFIAWVFAINLGWKRLLWHPVDTLRWIRSEDDLKILVILMCVYPVWKYADSRAAKDLRGGIVLLGQRGDKWAGRALAVLFCCGFLAFDLWSFPINRDPLWLQAAYLYFCLAIGVLGAPLIFIMELKRVWEKSRPGSEQQDTTA